MAGRSHFKGMSSLIDSKLFIIEKVDSSPLSWSLGTEFQKLKRVKVVEGEDHKLIQLAEKKVEAKREAEAVKARKVAEKRDRQQAPQRKFLGQALYNRQLDRSGREGHNEMKGGPGVSGPGFRDR